MNKFEAEEDAPFPMKIKIDDHFKPNIFWAKQSNDAQHDDGFFKHIRL